MCGYFTIHLPLDLELDLAPLEELSWVHTLALVLDGLVVLAVAVGLVFLALGLRDALLRPALRRLPLDPLRYPLVHAVLCSSRRWHGAEGNVLRARGRAALARVFGASWWRTVLTERAVRGRPSPGVAQGELRSWVSVYLDAAVPGLAPLTAGRGARRR